MLSSTQASVYLILALIGLSIKASAQKALEDSEASQQIVPAPTPAPAPAPAPTCFPVAPSPQPLPTFSGPVVQVPDDFDFQNAIDSATDGTTIVLDGSQGLYQLTATTVIGVSIRITSKDPSQPAVIVERSGGSGALQSSLFFQNVTGDILVDNVIIQNSLPFTTSNNSIGLRFETCRKTVGSSFVNNIFVDHVKFYAQQRCINTLDCGLQVTNCYFDYFSRSITASDSLRRISMDNIVADVTLDNNVVNSQPHGSGFSALSIFVAILSTAGFTIPNEATITITNTRQVGPYPMLRFIQYSDGSGVTNPQPLYKVYLHDNNVYTIQLIIFFSFVRLNQNYQLFSFQNNIVRLYNNLFPNPALFFTPTDSLLVASNFSTQFFFDNNTIDQPSSFVPYRQSLFQPMFSNLPLIYGAISKTAVSSVQGIYTAQFSIPCA